MIQQILIDRARDLYAVYCASSDGKNFQGNSCPAWDDLPEAVRGHWFTVAQRALELSAIDGDLPLVSADARGLIVDSTAGCIAQPRENPPGHYSLAHLPSMVHALEVWRRYSGIE